MSHTALHALGESVLANATAALLVAGLLALVADLVLTRRNNRVLTGESTVDGDDGLVGDVEALDTRTVTNRKALVSEGLLPLSDGGVDRGQGTATDGGQARPSGAIETAGQGGQGGHGGQDVTARLKGLIPLTVEESGWAYNGPFSTYKEFHAAILGFGAGFSGEPALVSGVASYAMGRGVSKAKDSGERADAHLRQVAEEPAYAVGSIAVGMVARRHRLLTALAGVVV